MMARRTTRGGGVLPRRAFLQGGTLTVLGGPALANAPARSIRPETRGENDPLIALRRAVRSAEELIREADLGGQVGFAVADARTGLVLESRAAGQLYPPASVAKAITALYALDALGAGYRFTTRLVATGPLRNGILEGDLVLAGGGDPLLDTDALGDMAGALKRAGMRGVRGGFLVYDGALPRIRAIDPGQPDHLGYNPAISGLNLNFNRVHFEWKRGGQGYSIAMEARARRYRPAVHMARMRVVNRDQPIYTYAEADNEDRWTVARRALGKGGSRWLPVRRPGVYAAEVFQTLAAAEGIRLPPAAFVPQLPSGGRALVVHQSAPLHDILRDLLKYSTNLTAEVVGLAASRARGLAVGDLGSSAGEMTRWLDRRIGGVGSHFVDHSGLGEASRATVNDLLRALIHEGPGSTLAGLLKRIPLRDGRGKEIRNHPVEVRAKTGTLNFVSTLAGFIFTPDGSELAFAILASDMPRRARIARADRETAPGARGWNKRARRLQQGLIERWVGLYGL